MLRKAQQAVGECGGTIAGHSAGGLGPAAHRARRHPAGRLQMPLAVVTCAGTRPVSQHTWLGGLAWSQLKIFGRRNKASPVAYPFPRRPPRLCPPIRRTSVHLSSSPTAVTLVPSSLRLSFPRYLPGRALTPLDVNRRVYTSLL